MTALANTAAATKHSSSPRNGRPRVKHHHLVRNKGKELVEELVVRPQTPVLARTIAIFPRMIFRSETELTQCQSSSNVQVIGVAFGRHHENLPGFLEMPMSHESLYRQSA